MTIFQAWKKFDDMSLTIKTLWALIGVLVMIIAFLIIGWMKAPSKMRFYIPPDLTQGAMIKANDIPKSTIYAFAYQIFTAINTWSTQGSVDYHQNLESYKNYLSPRFYRVLLEDYATRQANGSLGRQRLVTGISGMGYNPNDVNIIGNGTWNVTLHLKIQETVHGSVVKDILMDYSLIISRVNASIQVNPWGLVIGGYNVEPARVKTNI